MYDSEIKNKKQLCRILLDAPPHLCIDHLCQNRACIRTDHLELVSKAENTCRGAIRRRSECCKVCGSKEFRFPKQGYQGRKCRPCHRRQEHERLIAIHADPLRHEQYKKSERERKRKARNIRREKRRQAQLA